MANSKSLKLYCLKCGVSRQHRVVKKDFWEDKELDIIYEDEDIIEGEQAAKNWVFQITACIECGKRSFREFWHDGTLTEHDKAVYPRRGVVFRRKIEFLQVPEKLKDIYETGVDLFNEEKKLPCAICQRVVVEGVVKYKFIDSIQLDDAEKRRRKFLGLEKKLDEMAFSGMINQTVVDALKTLKNMGNDAAHEMEIPTMREISRGLDMIEALLRFVFGEHEPHMTKLATEIESTKNRRRQG